MLLGSVVLSWSDGVTTPQSFHARLPDPAIPLSVSFGGHASSELSPSSSALEISGHPLCLYGAICQIITPAPATGVPCLSSQESLGILPPSRIFAGLSLFNPQAGEQNSAARGAFAADQFPVSGPASSRLASGAALQPPVPRVPDPWVFRGNGGRGVKTWLSEGHILEINPHWLGFEMFDSMDLNMTDAPPGPGEMEPQEWRSTFTVGLSTDWQVTRAMAFSAGYRFYNNPMPEDITAGAFPNANQHVLAVGIRVQQGRHSVALVYGLDMLEGATAQITSARQNGNVDEMGHLVSFNYGFSF